MVDKASAADETRPEAQSPLVVVAIGGNALGSAARSIRPDDEWRTARRTADQLARLVCAGARLVVTHGNGPQVGHILLQSQIAAAQVAPLTMPVAVAHTQGGIGFVLGRALQDALAAAGSPATVAAVVTETVVDPNDPAFGRASKPIGAYMAADEAARLEAEVGWEIRDFGAPGWRRVVASPHPIEIVQLPAVRALVDAGSVVLTAGGGGIPIVSRNGLSEGIDAVVDKDRASSLIARELGADAFVIATAVERIALHYGTPKETPLATLTVSEARGYLEAGHFPEGSMGPKVESLIDYVTACPRGQGLVTRLDRILPALEGEAGTRILPDGI